MRLSSLILVVVFLLSGSLSFANNSTHQNASKDKNLLIAKAPPGLQKKGVSGISSFGSSPPGLQKKGLSGTPAFGSTPPGWDEGLKKGWNKSKNWRWNKETKLWENKNWQWDTSKNAWIKTKGWH